MTTTATYKCKSCREPFVARVADRNRGWARFCSKSCKAVKQRHSHTPHKRHDGRSPMKFKVCEDCGDPAVNGYRRSDGKVEWFCQHHMIVNSEHPFSSEALGQW